MLRLSVLELWRGPLSTSILAWSLARHRCLLRLLSKVVGLTRVGRCSRPVTGRLLLAPLLLLWLWAISVRLVRILAMLLLLLVPLVVLIALQMLRRLMLVLAAQLRADRLSQLIQHRLAR